MSNSAQEQEKLTLDSKWQPIETAPDGQETVLLLVDQEVYSGYRMQDGKWAFPFADYHGCGCCSDSTDQPTHWMPLPEPPTKGENK